MTDEANLYDDVMYEVPGAVLRELRTLRERDELRAFVAHNWGAYVLAEFDRNRRV